MDHPINDQKFDETKISTGVQERLENAEKFLGLTPVSKVIYERIQQIENRIFYLETVSPEYNHFLAVTQRNVKPKINKKTYTVSELNSYIHDLETKIERE